MTKIKPIAVYLTDTHLHKDNLDLVFDIFVQAKDLAIERGVGKIFHAGDFFTNRVAQNLRTLLTFSRILKMLEDAGIKLIGIPGNHDKTNQDIEDSYLDIFHKHKNFIVVRNYDVFKYNDLSVSFLPFFTSTYKLRLKKLKKLKLKLKNNQKRIIKLIKLVT